MKILVVDDDPGQLLLSSIALNDVGGFEVILAKCAAEAIERARQESPDVILMDMVLEDSDGAEVIARLQTDGATGSIPVIFHTAQTDSSAVSEMMALGAKGVIGKPFDPLKLAGEVRRILADQV